MEVTVQFLCSLALAFASMPSLKFYGQLGNNGVTSRKCCEQ
jgi:hypothetical protein